MADRVTIIIPADVPAAAHDEYRHNYAAITHDTGRLFMFSCDQKMEHLNTDFYGPKIHLDALYPEHFFNVASKGRVGALATHLGLIARYAQRYQGINYIVKLNGKTNLVKSSVADPLSNQLWSVQDVVTFKKQTRLPICGVGYTIYIGSSYEHIMLGQAAQIVWQAHQQGLVAILWVYTRGASVKDDESPAIIAGAAGVAASLGADFVKVKSPVNPGDVRIAADAAGTTKVICSGGTPVGLETFLQKLYTQLQSGGASGCATGRSIFQHSLPEAIGWTHALAALVFDQQTVAQAIDQYKKALLLPS